MQKRVINIGDRIDMTHLKSAVRRKLSENTYVSSILDYDGKRALRISAPMFESRLIPVQVGDEYEFCIYTSTELYKTKARIVRRFREGKVFVVDVEMLTPLEKFQRRQFFRLDCTIKMRYRIISEEEKALRDFIRTHEFEDAETMEMYLTKLESYLGDWDRGMLTDISGGGVRFQCSKRIEPNRIVEVSFPLKFEERTVSFCCMAKVVAVADISFDGMSEIELRCEFYEIEKEKQELVVKYVFEEQRRRIKNRWGWQQETQQVMLQETQQEMQQEEKED